MSLTALGLVIWRLTNRWTALIVCVLGAAFILLALNFATHYTANDFALLQDVKGLNARTRARNQREAALQEEINKAKGIANTSAKPPTSA